MSILPTFLSANAVNEAQAESMVVPIPREFEIDFETGQLTGRIVEGKEAIKVWIWNVLHTERFRYPIYSWDYGVEYEQYIGESVSEEYLHDDCESETEEALLESEYISEIRDFEVSVAGSTLHISFTAVTSLGELEVETDV